MARHVYRPPSRVYWQRPQITHWAPPVLPLAPTSFTLAAQASPTKLDWTLTDNAHSETQINVYYRVQGSGDPWTKEVYPANTASGTLTGLTNGSTYEAYATAEHNADESLPSNSATATAGGSTAAQLVNGAIVHSLVNYGMVAA